MESTRNSMRAFGAAFKDRYINAKTDQWKEIVAVFDLKQTAGQSVEDFIALVLKKGKKAQAANEQLRAAIIKGLRPYLRQQVLQHEPQSIDEIRKWALVAESTEAQDDRPSSDLVAAVEEMKKQSAAVRDLQEQIQRIHLRGLSWNRPADRSPSPGPRVRFNETTSERQGTPPPQRQEQNDSSARAPTNYSAGDSTWSGRAPDRR